MFIIEGPTQLARVCMSTILPNLIAPNLRSIGSGNSRCSSLRAAIGSCFIRTDLMTIYMPRVILHSYLKAESVMYVRKSSATNPELSDNAATFDSRKNNKITANGHEVLLNNRRLVGLSSREEISGTTPRQLGCHDAHAHNGCGSERGVWPGSRVSEHLLESSGVTIVAWSGSRESEHLLVSSDKGGVAEMWQQRSPSPLVIGPASFKKEGLESFRRGQKKTLEGKVKKRGDTSRGHAYCDVTPRCLVGLSVFHSSVPRRALESNVKIPVYLFTFSCMRPVAYPSRGRGAVALVGVAMMSRDGPRMRARRKNSAGVMLSSVADGGGQELSWQPNRSVTRRAARIASYPPINVVFMMILRPMIQIRRKYGELLRQCLYPSDVTFRTQNLEHLTLKVSTERDETFGTANMSPDPRARLCIQTGAPMAAVASLPARLTVPARMTGIVELLLWFLLTFSLSFEWKLCALWTAALIPRLTRIPDSSPNASSNAQSRQQP
uniref:Uncharacterized protein n=1 Tax=Timema monikensis TaxID=170555 RepID=A0A7R9HMU6_9NEOP|nr:unnamed protein product [Timema monikensis]